MRRFFSNALSAPIDVRYFSIFYYNFSMNTETIKTTMLGSEMFEMQKIRKKRGSKINKEMMEDDA